MKLALLLLLTGVAHADATWPQIEALAKPLAKRGPSAKLDEAIDFANAHEDAQALAALHDWVAANGGLPAFHPGVVERHRTTTQLMKVAIEGQAFADVAYFAKVTIEDAASPAAIATGAKLLRRVRARTPDKLPAAKVDLVRMLAADALRTRETNAWMHTPDGQKAIAEFFAGKPVDMAPFDDELAFFPRALDGAKRGEPVDTTLDRIDKAHDVHALGFDRAQLAQAVSDISELGK